jgi:hypothetical protein
MVLMYFPDAARGVLNSTAFFAPAVVLRRQCSEPPNFHS